MIALTVFILILLILILLKRLRACFADGCQVRTLLGNSLHGCGVLNLLLGKLSFGIHRFVNSEPKGVCSSGGERGKQRGKAGPRHFCCQNPFFKSSGLSDLSDVQNSLKIEM